jgi:exopolyphosphatase / guanosine-5'-triphosphate,3'-diphosphate pyrophosphatase
LRHTLRAACIDIGSNTTRLLVADVDDGRLEVVTEAKAFTALGRELQAHGRIGAPKLVELVAVVEAQVAAAQRLGAVETRAVATDAVRRAANGRRLAREVAERTGAEIEILSAGEEARLAFTGAVGMLDEPPTGLVGVVDVGGGSSELVVGEPGWAPAWWESVPLGSSSVTDRWLHSDPPRASELAAALDQIRDAVAGLSPPRPGRALAVGGSATSLGCVAGTLLDAPAFARALYLLGTEPSAALGDRIGVDPRRVRLLPAALLLLEAMAARLGVPLTVSRGGIREGLLLELAVR